MRFEPSLCGATAEGVGSILDEVEVYLPASVETSHHTKHIDDYILCNEASRKTRRLF